MTTPPDLVDAPAGVRVDIDAHPLRHLCPFKNEVDEGTIRLSWVIEGRTFELHSLATYLASFADLEVSHEDLTDRISRDLGVKVTTEWVTAGIAVRFTAGPLSAGVSR